MNGIRDLKRLTQIQKLIEKVNGCTQARQSTFTERTKSKAFQAEGEIKISFVLGTGTRVAYEKGVGLPKQEGGSPQY